MPTFAWLINDGQGRAVMSPPLPHTCFAQVGGLATRTDPYKDSKSYTLAPNAYKFYAASHGSYKDTVLWAEKVNESVLKKYPFTLTAHRGDSEDSPFKASRWVKPPDPNYGKPDAHYWCLEWEVGTQWDLVYAVTKLIFKNITYGTRTNCGDTNAGMMKILREGGNIFEAMIFSSQYLSNGYGYPIIYNSRKSAESVKKFIDEGPQFATESWGSKVLGTGEYVSIGGNHNPINHHWGGDNTTIPKVGGTRQHDVTLAQLRADLLNAIGE